MAKWIAVAVIVMVMAARLSFQVSAQNQMSFFVTSAGSGNGANLGGIAGADKICQTLGEAAGGKGKTWRAYLSAKAATCNLPSMRRIASAMGPGTTPRA